MNKCDFFLILSESAGDLKNIQLIFWDNLGNRSEAYSGCQFHLQLVPAVRAKKHITWHQFGSWDVSFPSSHFYNNMSVVSYFSSCEIFQNFGGILNLFSVQFWHFVPLLTGKASILQELLNVTSPINRLYFPFIYFRCVQKASATFTVAIFTSLFACKLIYCILMSSITARIFPPRRLRIDTPLPVKQLPNIMSIQDVKTTPHTRPQTASVSIKKKDSRNMEISQKKRKKFTKKLPNFLCNFRWTTGWRAWCLLYQIVPKELYFFVNFKCFPVFVNSTIFLSDNIIFETCFFEICFCI